MKIAIIDTLGLCYDGTTLTKQGLGGSESAVILMSAELAKLGFQVDVYNNCNDSKSSSGTYDGVRYIDHTEYNGSSIEYDVFISSRSVLPFISVNSYANIAANAKHRVLWMHDTFCQGDEHIENLLTNGVINEVFTLSDFHTSYVTTSDHGHKRMFEVMKKYVWQTRNGAVKRIAEVDLSLKDRNHFVYNASATKGLIPLLMNIWPEVKKQIPTAKLTCIGGFYRFREGAAPDAQEQTVRDLMANPAILNMDVTFTGVIDQNQIANILANASFMLYPTEFPETFGISSLESLLYKTPIITSNFGALEETAVDLACYKVDYPAVPNNLFPHVDVAIQTKKFVDAAVNAYHDTYLHQQKQNYCDVVADVAGWDTVALQWKQHFYSKLNAPLPVDEYIAVSRINDKVARVFGRRFLNAEEISEYKSYGPQQKIVIVSPFWNAENYIERHILSVAQQNYDNYMHVLIDDASTDRSYDVAKQTISHLHPDIQGKFVLIKNDTNKGAIANQIHAFSLSVQTDDIVMLLDGDDWLVNNNTIFHYYNDLYSRGYDFTYGSMWSLADNIPLIAQDYPSSVIQSKLYRDHKFNWGIPYTHLRTFNGSLTKSLDWMDFKIDGEWMKAGADNPLFYALIEKASRPYAVKEIMVEYNDVNPLNDYKIRSEEQNKNANQPIKMKRLDNDITWDLIAQDWNNGFSELIPRLASTRNSIVVQAGGNQGLYPVLLSHYYKEVYTFEPNKTTYPILVENCQGKNIKTFNVGLGSSNKMVYGHTDQSNNCGKFELNMDQTGDCEIITLDSLNLNGCDLLWLDTEKTEHAAILGATNTITKFKPIVIVEGPETTNFVVNQLLATLGYVETGRVNNDCIFEYAEHVKPPSNENKMKTILIAVPTNKYVETETMKSIYDLDVPAGYKTDLQFFYGYQVDQIRNLIADWAKNYDYLFSVDSDIVLPRDSLQKMINANRDVVSGLYIQRIQNTHTLEVYKQAANGGTINIPYEEIAGKGLVEIAGCGFGCALIKGDVFRNMPYPHFVYKSAIDHKHTVSEDIYFCEKARSLGFKLFADTTILCEHIGNNKFVVGSFPQHAKPVEKTHVQQIAEIDLLPAPHAEYLKEMNIQPKVIYDIGASLLHWTNKAKEVWPNAQYFLADATETTREFLAASGHPYYLGVLSDEDGKMINFYEDPQNPGGNSYYKENTPFYNESHAKPRITLTLDTITAKLPKPDLIKIDVQGAELDVLRGGMECLKHAKDVILEAQHVNYNEGAPKVEEVIAFMNQHGFDLVSRFCYTDVDGDYHFKRLQ